MWGGAGLAAEALHFILFWIFGQDVFGQSTGSHRLAVATILFAWLLGFVGGACGIAGLFRDESKWLSVFAVIIFPFSVIVLV